MKKDLKMIEDAKENIQSLYNSLMGRPDKSAHLLNITDVLAQVYLKLDDAKNPEILLTKMVKYIYIEGFSRITLSRTEESTLIKLADLAKKAGSSAISVNGNFGDKSQFYSIFEQIPQR